MAGKVMACLGEKLQPSAGFMTIVTCGPTA